MRLSDLIGKDIINISDGARLGTVGDSDLIINGETGFIESIVLPNSGGFLGMWGGRSPMVIPWQAVKKIGSEVIVVEIDQNSSRYRSSIF